MAESYQEKKKKSEELFRTVVTEKPEETTPASITSPINSFAQKLGQEPPRYVPVVKDSTGLYGWCSDGVLEKIKHDGGGIRFGWTIWEWPRVLLTGEFHAVWHDPSGELIDITSKPHEEDRIVFVPIRATQLISTSTSDPRTSANDSMNLPIFLRTLPPRSQG